MQALMSNQSLTNSWHYIAMRTCEWQLTIVYHMIIKKCLSNIRHENPPYNLNIFFHTNYTELLVTAGMPQILHLWFLVLIFLHRIYTALYALLLKTIQYTGKNQIHQISSIIKGVMFVCLFVCIYVPHGRPNGWADRDQTWHTHSCPPRECFCQGQCQGHSCMRAGVTELWNTQKATPGERCSNYVRRTGEATPGERLRNSVRTTGSYSS